MDRYGLRDWTIPDAPDIELAERTGIGPGEKPEKVVYCPMCGRECETIYQDMYANPCGCEWCVRELDAHLWADGRNE